MKEHKVVVMPNAENLERRASVAEFILAQEKREPPKFKRPVMPAGSMRVRPNIHEAKSPGRRRHSNPRISNRDIVQEVYDRMGVNYVRGQSSLEVNDGSGSTINSSAVRKPNQTPAVDTRNEADDDDRDGEKSVRSTRSVKSLMSVFDGGKSVASRKSVSRSGPLGRANHDTSPSEEVKEKVIDCPNNDDMDGAMSVLSLDESQWENQQSTRASYIRGRMASFRNSNAKDYGSVKSHNQNTTRAVSKSDNSNSLATNSSFPIGLEEERINNIVEEKLKEKIAELNAKFEEKLRCLEERTNQKIKEMEMAMMKSQEERF